jgi:hypothetical protein
MTPQKVRSPNLCFDLTLGDLSDRHFFKPRFQATTSETKRS